MLQVTCVRPYKVELQNAVLVSNQNYPLSGIIWISRYLACFQVSPDLIMH